MPRSPPQCEQDAGRANEAISRSRATRKRKAKGAIIKHKVHSPVLVNATEMARAYPSEFEVPTKRELRAIGPGSLVKVCDQGERFWVQVTARDGDLILGLVDSFVISDKGYGYNDLIEFSVDNVYDIWQAKNKRSAKK